MIGFRLARQVISVQKRNFLNVENSNKIASVRKSFYSNPEVGAANPTYLKENGDYIVTGVALTLLTVGVGCILNGLKNMSFGINKVN